MVIFHITTQKQWQQALLLGEYRAPSLESEGFIHCSTGEQVIKVANAFYRGQSDLVLLCIETEKLTSVLKWEPPTHPSSEKAPLVTVKERFPHIYGVIAIAAVIKTLPLIPKTDGSFRIE